MIFQTDNMRSYLSVFLLVGILIFPLLSSCRQEPAGDAVRSLPLVMDMVFPNPGESPPVTKYTDPYYLKKAGYNGMVPAWHIQCAITYDSFEKGIIPDSSVERRWILEKQRTIRQHLHRAVDAGMPVYAFMDVLVLPEIILTRYKDRIVRDEDAANHIIGGRLRPDIRKPLTRRLLRVQVDEIFSTFPELDGLVIRFGETYLFDTPYHAGGNPVGGDEEARIAGHVQLISILREEVCVKRNKKLFYRTWDFGFFHTRPDVYRRITDQVEPHPNLFFSIKYPRGDFQRLLPFNPTLGIGKHRYVVEYQCQPEYYGKGAHPYYLFDGVLNGFEEYDQILPRGWKRGLCDLTGDPRFAGLWTWSRGGGWRGPYITNELWCDLNARAAVTWAHDTTLTADQVLDTVARSLGVAEKSRDVFRDLVRLSTRGVVRGHASLIDIPQARFNVWWIRDQYMSDMHMLNTFFDYLIRENKVEKALREKQESVEIWRRMERLAGEVRMKDPRDEEYLRVSVTYGRIKYEIIANAFTVVLLGYKGDKTGHYEKKRMREALARYDELWKAWRRLKAENPSCATLYEPNAFGMNEEGVFGDKRHGLQQRIERYRKICRRTR